MRIAAVDIGTNATRLLIADAVEGGLVEVERHTIVTGLGNGVDRAGRLSPDAINRTATVLGRYGSRIRALRVERRQAVATSAAREAANQDLFLAAAERELGFRPEVITGAAEAGLAYAGATAGAADGGLVVDIGGGSTEFVTGSVATSVDIGSVRATERYLPNLPASSNELAAASRGVAAALASVPVPGEIDEVIAVAGTWTSLSAIAQGLDAYDRTRVHRSRLSRQEVDHMIVALAAKTLEETEAIPSLDPARAPVILGGAIVAHECVRVLGVGHVTVSEHDLLDGVALGLAVI